MGTKQDASTVSGLVQIKEFFQACADQTRLRILSLLASREEVCVCHLVDVLKTNQPKVSRHLAYLKRAGLVTDRKDGLWVYYRLTTPLAEPVERLLRNLQVCCADIAETQRDLQRLQALQSAPSTLARSIRTLAAVAPVLHEETVRTELQVELL